MIILNMPSIGLYRSRYKSRTRLRSRNFIALLLAFLASFCILFHLISFNNYGLRAFTGCADRSSENSNKLELHGAEESYSTDEYISITRDRYKKLNENGEPEMGEGAPHFPRTRRRLPQCIIIGARKGGTRALLEFLNLHPSIQKASDEVHFFDDDSKYSYGLTWYRKQMPYSFPEQVTIEKTPAYFITDSVPYRIHSMNSSIKLILIVRDPVTRLISDYAQLAENKAKKDRKMASFEKMVLQSDGTVNIGYKPVRTSLYSIYYARWAQVFPAEQLHVVDGDRLVYDPFPEVQKAEAFLGLEHKISRDNFIYNATKGFYCVRVNGTLEKCLNESKGRPHPEVEPQVVRILRRFYRPYNHQFYKMTGKNFGWPEM